MHNNIYTLEVLASVDFTSLLLLLFRLIAGNASMLEDACVILQALQCLQQAMESGLHSSIKGCPKVGQKLEHMLDIIGELRVRIE